MTNSPLSGENTLDKIISYCHAHNINTKESLSCGLKPSYNGNLVEIDNFIFEAHKHDTGCDLGCWIVTENDYYAIINTTFWYSSIYTFNPSKWEKGKWDKALDKAIETLTYKVKEHKKATKTANDLVLKERDKEKMKRKAKFEALFEI